MPLEARTAEIVARRDGNRRAAAFREWAVVALTAACTLVAIAVAAVG